MNKQQFDDLKIGDFVRFNKGSNNWTTALTSGRIYEVLGTRLGTFGIVLITDQGEKSDYHASWFEKVDGKFAQTKATNIPTINDLLRLVI